MPKPLFVFRALRERLNLRMGQDFLELLSLKWNEGGGCLGQTRKLMHPATLQ
jgi:hypothetical protein